MHFCKYLVFFISIILYISCQADTVFAPQKDYIVLAPAVTPVNLPTHKILIQEFFNYGCPWCYNLEPYIEQWLAQHKHVSYIEFERIPVVFHPSWELFAQTYYALEILHVQNHIHPLLFKAIQEDRIPLEKEEAMISFLKTQGVSDSTFKKPLHSSLIQDKLNEANILLNNYQIYSIPSIVINGKYRIDNSLTQGNDKRFIAILNFLVNKEKNNL